MYSYSEEYKLQNDIAKKELIKVLKKKKLSKDKYSRCCKELDILYEESTLFIIYLLYKYHYECSYFKYHFRGMYNSFLILYELGISDVDPIKYNLHFELVRNCSYSLEFDIVDHIKNAFLFYMLKDRELEFSIVKGGFMEDDKDFALYCDDHYLLLPYSYSNSNRGINDLVFRFNKDNMFETIQDYRDYREKYLTIRIGSKNRINSKEVTYKNILSSELELELERKLKPETMEEYAKIKSICAGVDVWNYNQEELFDKRLININNLISCREDIFEYLIDHNIDENTAIEIINIIRKGQQQFKQDKWREYIDLMLSHNCEEMYIDIFSKIKYIFSRGQAISECLFALNKDNYN